MTWRTRKRGTFLQIGKKFPVSEKKKLPPKIKMLSVGGPRHPLSGRQGKWDFMQVCHDCGIKEGEIHKLGCDMEACPICGGQLISCGHYEEVVKSKQPRVPYVHNTVLCAKCGYMFPQFFRAPDEDWRKHVPPNFQGKILCLSCFKKMKTMFPRGWRKVELENA